MKFSEGVAIIFGPLLRMTSKGMPQLPFFLRGVVVKGFGRGAKELGCPTANFSDDVVEQVPPSIKNGIYYGFAQGKKKFTPTLSQFQILNDVTFLIIHNNLAGF